MADNLHEFMEEAKLYINNNNWLLDESDKIFKEFKEIDWDTVDEEYLNDLLIRMDYLQGKIHSEQRSYNKFVDENEEYMDE